MAVCRPLDYFRVLVSGVHTYIRGPVRFFVGSLEGQLSWAVSCVDRRCEVVLLKEYFIRLLEAVARRART